MKERKPLGKKSITHDPRRRGLQAVAGLLIAAALILSVLLSMSFRQNATAYKQTTGLYQNDSKETIAALLIVSDENTLRQEKASLQQALAQAGIASQSLDAAQTTTPQQMSDAVSALAQQTKLLPQQVWLMSAREQVAVTAALAADVEIAGQIWLAPSAWSDAAEPELSGYYQDQTIFIVASGQEKDSLAMQALFERLSGEDASLYDPARPQGPGRIWHYRSVDGTILLSLYPDLSLVTLPYDVRVAADLAVEIGSQALPQDQSLASLAAAATTFQIGQLRLAILAMLLLVAVPFFLPLRWLQDASKRRRLELKPILDWLIALSLLIGIGYLWRRTGGDRAYEFAGLLLLLPGSYGLAMAVTSWFSLQLRRQPAEQNSDESTLPRQGLWISLVLTAVVLQLALFWLWRINVYGLYGLTIPVLLAAAFLLLWNLPGFWPQQRKKRSTPLTAVLATTLSHLPYALILLMAAIRYGRLTLAATLLFLVWLVWSDRNGRILAAVSHNLFLGRLIRSLFLVSACLHPGISGLFMR